ncbi:long-chain fatty acid--CoA ligase [Nocardia sp. NPDC005978]|uniref:AMP-dependent synthetase/ligase n=1 Tax=Nocardia sp. NPDC005978 TaxID=3156725 RepID=UPI0033B6A207
MHHISEFFGFEHARGHTVWTLPAAFQATLSIRPEAVALRIPGGGREFTWQQYGHCVRRIAAGLSTLGVGFGDTVAIMLTNRPEFHLIDTAALHVGATPFSIYNTLPPEQIAYVCANAGNRVIVTERQFLPRIAKAGITFAHIICVDYVGPGVLPLKRLIRAPAQGFDFEATWRLVRPDDLATITYTSGTTGAPKGVELTHSNILAQLAGVSEQLRAGPDDRIVSYLPAAHIADRVTAHYGGLAWGLQVTSVADPHHLSAALHDARPTILFGVPQIWQKARAAIETRIEGEPKRSRQALARWAFEVGGHAAHAEAPRGLGRLRKHVRRRVADRLVLARIRQQLGLDQLRFAASGAAPIPVQVLEYFQALGIEITEVWGLSEAAGVSTATTRSTPALGSVGTPIPGAEIKLDRDGQIMVRGPMVMRGYRGDLVASTAAIDAHGWLATGDLGTLDADGNLRIIGRSSEMIINDTGKNIAPACIESGIVAASFLIGHVMVIGDGRPYLTALVALDREAIAADCAASGVRVADVEILCARPGIRRQVLEAVLAGNRLVSRPEQIKRFLLLDHYWEPGSEQLTPKNSMRRHAIERCYEDDIEELYSEYPGPEIIDLGHRDRENAQPRNTAQRS